MAFNLQEVLNLQNLIAPTVLNAWGQQIRVDCTVAAADVMLTLPPSGTLPPGGQTIEVIKQDSTIFRVLVTPFAGETIAGDGVNYILGNQEDSVKLRATFGVGGMVDIVGFRGEMFPSQSTIVAAYSPRLRELVSIDPTAGAASILLPNITAYNKLQRIRVKNITSSAVGWIATPVLGQTIDTAAGASAFSGAFFSVEFVSDGVSNWMVFNT